MVYKTGTSSSKSTSRGYIGGDVRSSYSAVTQTTEMSHLASTTQPPQPKGILGTSKGVPGIIFLIMGLLFLIGVVIGSMMIMTILGSFISVIFIIIAIRFFVLGSKEAEIYNKTQYIAALNEWKHSYVCLQCGNRFLIES